MSGWWLASYIVLWVLVIALLLLVVGLLQQVGLLHGGSRVEAPAATDAPPVAVDWESDGPPIGSQLPSMSLETVNGFGTVEVRAALADQDRLGTLIVCMSALCPSCQDLVDPINALVKSGTFRGHVVVLLRALEPERHAFLSVFPIHAPVVGDEARAALIALGVHASPFALFYDGDGILARKGVVKDNAALRALIGASVVAAPATAPEVVTSAPPSSMVSL